MTEAPDNMHHEMTETPENDYTTTATVNTQSTHSQHTVNIQSTYSQHAVYTRLQILSLAIGNPEKAYAKSASQQPFYKYIRNVFD